ncbi:2OG-Fe(II) oxygenase family protein [Lysobacter solisilvae (ex Woo and Kim 2020)]|uniref:2OG-Fe(II) oxygenase n=1 Tax=Agrilutibacter terrestris TaxID=2865112 RepID=A0A7H0FZH3_9GAMM|nr:2OG-Fe(II) oxygenase [Lysobacter terrestris]QNP41439.1 2OG-Fe(II) oxygenase [Lysobacter terrestris]
MHTEFAGAPLWLVRLDAGVVAAALPPVPEGVNALCVAAQPPAELPAGWRGFRAEPRWLDLLAADVLWQVDTNLRLVGSHGLPLSASLPVATAKELDAASMRDAAPVLQIPGVFEPDFCAALIAHLDEQCGGGEPSRVLALEGGAQTLYLDPTIKQRRESLPRDPQLEAAMHERLLRRALPEIARVFNFQVNRRDAFKLLAYPQDAGYFRAHRDNATPDVAHRRFALSINLNQGGYVGGEFRFPEFAPNRYSPATGGALVFSCSLLHEVLPVEQGTRYAVTTFLY